VALFRKLTPSDDLARPLFEHAPIAMLMVDRAGAVQQVNAAAEKLFGYSKDELAGRPVEMLLPHEVSELHVALRQKFMEEPLARPMGAGRSLWALGKDGRKFRVEVGLNPVTIGSEPIVIASVLDISRRQEAEQRAAMIAQELAHRTKNLIAVINSMAQRIASTSADLPTFQHEFSSRLQSLGISLDLLIKSNWRGALIRSLVEEQLHFVGEATRSAIVVDGPPLIITPTAVEYLGLALHELATNASKHGALSVPNGKVDVSWAATRDQGEATFRFEWVERDGPVARPPIRQGFGSVILEQAVPAALSGSATFEMAPAGARWSLTTELGNALAEEE
jgi:PAS domain S-box-containing protein